MSNATGIIFGCKSSSSSGDRRARVRDKVKRRRKGLNNAFTSLFNAAMAADVEDLNSPWDEDTDSFYEQLYISQLHQRLSHSANGCLRANLSGCKIGDQYISVILQAIGRSNSISEVDLWDNDLSSEGIQSFIGSKHEEAISKITWLSLGRNRIGNEGISHFSLGYSSRCLQHLNLSSNGIDSHGIEYLSKTLLDGNFPVLSVLNLNGNSLRAEGAVKVAEVLKSNGYPHAGLTLEQLHISDNYLGPSGISALIHAIGNNPHSCLLELYLSNNQASILNVKELNNLLSLPRSCRLIYVEIGIGNFDSILIENDEEVLKNLHFNLEESKRLFLNNRLKVILCGLSARVYDNRSTLRYVIEHPLFDRNIIGIILQMDSFEICNSHQSSYLEG